MCDFKPGDEVVCVDASPKGLPTDNLVEGRSYTIREILWRGIGVTLWEVSPIDPLSPGFFADRFRKVERRKDKLNLTEWLSQPSGDTDGLDKTLPVKKRERVS